MTTSGSPAGTAASRWAAMCSLGACASARTAAARRCVRALSPGDSASYTAAPSSGCVNASGSSTRRTSARPSSSAAESPASGSSPARRVASGSATPPSNPATASASRRASADSALSRRRTERDSERAARSTTAVRSGSPAVAACWARAASNSRTPSGLPAVQLPGPSAERLARLWEPFSDEGRHGGRAERDEFTHGDRRLGRQPRHESGRAGLAPAGRDDDADGVLTDPAEQIREQLQRRLIRPVRPASRRRPSRAAARDRDPPQ